MDAIHAGNVQHVPLQGMDALSQYDRRFVLEHRTSRKIVLFCPRGGEARPRAAQRANNPATPTEYIQKRPGKLEYFVQPISCGEDCGEDCHKIPQIEMSLCA